MAASRVLALVLTLGSLAIAAPVGADPGPMAFHLSLQLARELHPEPGMVARVQAMLDLAVELEPAVASIPADPNGSCRELVVGLETGTGPAALEASATGLPVEEVRPMGGGDLFLVRMAETLGCPALVARYTRIPGVKFVEPNRMIGMSAAAHLRRVDDGYELEFWRGEGDCPAGCIRTQHWIFRFDAEGKLLGRKVELRGEGAGTAAPGTGGIGIGIPVAPDDPGIRLDVESTAPDRPSGS